MLKVGLTGGIGSGKTIVAEIFMKFGVPVFFADSEAKKLMVSDPVVRAGILSLLGDDAYSEDQLNTKYIAGKVFNNELLLRQLNSIVHPAVYKRFLEWAKGYSDKDYVLHEAAVLLESGAKKHFDYIVIVTAPEPERIRRVMDRDKVSEEQVRERMKNQYNEEERLAMSDYIIENNNSKLIIPQILDLHHKLVSLNSKQ